jgi:hypothetical protein
MGKCKNIECENETKDKRVYCSLTCRNYYVNKYLRDYSKVSVTLTNKSKNYYTLKPKKCKKCNGNIPYSKRQNDYCSTECSLSNINKNRKGIKYVMSDSGLENLRKSACKNLNGLNYEETIKSQIEYFKSPNICPNCLKVIAYTFRSKLKYCSKKCLNEFRRKEMSEFSKYKQDTKFNFNLADYPNEFDFSLIEEYGWYSPSNSNKPNINGVSRDHMISVKEGFRMNIDPKLLSHPANCELMKHSDNISKYKKCSLTIDELLGKIDNWNKKYNIG